MTGQGLILLLQAISMLLITLTLAVYFFQWRTMNKQLGTSLEQVRIAREGVVAQNLFALVNYIQEPEAREARAWVLQRLADLPYQQWKTEDRDKASRVCSKYDMVGLLVRQHVVPLDPVLASWGPSIRKCHEALREFIAEMRVKNGPGYWSSFDWLYQQTEGQGESAVVWKT